MKLILITGMSGGGKSQAAGILEDLGYYCVDNLPAELITCFVELCYAAEEKYDKVALVSDIRAKESFHVLREAIQTLRAQGTDLRILFMEASVETIVKRYKETRRRHPLDTTGGMVQQAIGQEHEAVAWLKELADVVVDTTDYPLQKLKQRLTEEFDVDAPKNGITVTLLSFGYKYGIPLEADLVFDVRFMPNPFYLPELREHNGLEPEVRNFVLNNETTQGFLERATELLCYSIPYYESEGKPSLIVCVGCTGGHHRSVAVAEELGRRLREKGFRAQSSHRNLK